MPYRTDAAAGIGQYMSVDWQPNPRAGGASFQVIHLWLGELTLAIAACYVICAESAFSAGDRRSSNTYF